MADILVPTDQDNLTDAIAAAINGDTIIIEESLSGANNKNLNLGGLDPLTIKGEDGKYIKVDLENSGRFITFNNGESINVVLENIHIHNGNVGGAVNGGAIDVLNASNPLIRNLLITSCEARLGGAICFNGCSTIQVRNCTMVGNIASGWGGALYSGNSSTSFVYDCIIWGNDCTGGAGRGDQVDSQSTRITFDHCNIENAVPDDIVGTVTLTDCIYTDPLFVAGPNGDYYLSQIASGQGADSPCLNTGSDTAVNLNMDERTTRTDETTDASTVDIGWHYAAPTTHTWTQDGTQHKEGSYSFKQVGPKATSDDYYMQEIDVVAGEDYYVEVFGDIDAAPTAGYFYLQAYDVTGDAEIDVAKITTTATTDFVKFAFYFTAPAGCAKVEIRIGGNIKGGTCYWDACDSKRIRAKGYV